MATTTKLSDFPNLVALQDLTAELRQARQATEQTVLQRSASGTVIGSLKLPPPSPTPLIEGGRRLIRSLPIERGSAWHLQLAVVADFADAAGPEYAEEAADLRRTLVEEGFRADSL